jgi:hypothetical protein
VREPEALEFVLHRGFREFGREIESVLTVTSPPEVASPPGIEITNLGDRPELAEACHAIDAEAVSDIPAGAELVAGPVERWRATNLEGPAALPHACTVALAGDVVVGYAALLARTAEPGTAELRAAAAAAAHPRAARAPGRVGSRAVHLRRPSIDHGIISFVWAFTIGLLLWLFMLGIGISKATSFVIAALVACATFLYVRLYGEDEPRRRSSR